MQGHNQFPLKTLSLVPCILVCVVPGSSASLTFSAVRMNRKRAHHKIRTGCRNCKLERIKCDEVNPQCSACQTFDLQCEYLAPTQGSHALIPLTDHGEPGPTHSLLLTTPPTTEQIATHISTRPSRSPLTEPMVSHDSKLDDLKLMHNWTRVVYRGFGDREEDSVGWRDAIVQKAFDHLWLIHTLLAVSALHLAMTSEQSIPQAEQSEYLRQANEHHMIGMKHYQTLLASACESITEHETEAALACGALITAFSMAYACREGQKSHQINPYPHEVWLGLPEWIKLHRGRRGALPPVPHMICHGPLAHQLRSQIVVPYCPASPHHPQLVALEE